ncbi:MULTISPECIES: potassium channel family protein [Alteribacter]|uniref:TrkA family potassium uptake protein n=1 Tax=Alteribacter keqinensis TaxID=2483800 RepID=A0A3M7TX30_9BACI|nr:MULTISPECIES: TrkA family potassium uptake protein [Alteribacter]MBM7096004.1 TrkA family potassium uptake protein [Alteribacter salitolerans]RNA69821.1 TrkA family potassium uptake protein [Alteribacter keqinensis]
MKKQFAIIGLGRFGSSVCKELHRMNHDVLAIDKDKHKVNELKNHATHTMVADGTDETVMSKAGIRNFDHVIVAIGEDIQASILCTLILKDFDIKQVWVKAQNDHHHKVLEKIGADKVFHPESDMGERIAEFLTSEKVIDYIDLSDEFSIVETLATEKVKGKSLADLDIRAKYGCTIIAIKQKNKVDVTPHPEDRLNPGDILVVIGHKNDLRRFQKEGL